ncbi:MAG TPA: oligosaccharide flippase family protein [Blastocatellia bacterium]|nr:oligosaccharide flippase family protein [Blastocatellia bacterium]
MREEMERGESAGEQSLWGEGDDQLGLIARNVSMDYVATGFELVIGVLMLPFNVAHLGQSAYGLWMLAASITMYFSILDMGYGLAQVKFAAQYRAKRDGRAINEIASTMFVVFSAVGLVVFGVAALLAYNFESFFNVTPDQAATGRKVLLIISAYIALSFPFSVFGGVVNGFQRKYLNGTVSVSTSVVVALVNVAVLLAGYGLVELVAATTVIRMVAYVGYRLNAYRVFPALRISLKNFKLARLREITGFSAFMLLLDLANKLNYSADTIIIGAFISTAAIAIWAVANRLIDVTQRLTDQLNGALFMVVVDSATSGDSEKLRLVLLQGTRLSLAMVIPVAGGLALLAEPLVLTWVGPDFLPSVPVIHILAAVVIFRVGNASATTLLKGAGHHRLLAYSNVAIAIANIVLSVVLVRTHGIIGVALGTLIPLSLISMFVLFPAACRRAGVSIGRALSEAVWPAAWPASLMAAFLVVSSRFAGNSPVSIALQSVAAGVLYAAIFLWLAIGREERLWYLAKSRQLLRRPRVTQAA